MQASTPTRCNPVVGQREPGRSCEDSARLGLTPKARIVATALSGADPTIMLTGPGPASKKALAKAGLRAEDMDLIEINEAFAAVALRLVQDLDVDMEKVNVNGGAIAMGHPLGATGAMILGTIIDPRIQLGFPEVQLGLLPGAGGVVRSVRMLGIVDALMNLLLQGQRVRPDKALEMGLIGEVVATPDELLPAAKAWIAEHPEAVQPWDVKGYRMPGGLPSNPKLAQNLPAFPSNLRKQLKGANYPAPKAIMAVAVEGAQVDMDTALAIEGRWFTSLAVGSVSKNMIQAVEADGGSWNDHPAFAVIDAMIEAGRPSCLRGAGFYDYEDGKRTGLWPGLREQFPVQGDPSSLSLVDLEERMLFIESLETIKCLDEGVIESVADANIGSIMGIGFPGWTGGVLQYVNGYAGGVAGFVARARELAAQYGERFEPPASLVAKAEAGETYSDAPALATA